MTPIRLTAFASLLALALSSAAAQQRSGMPEPVLVAAADGHAHAKTGKSHAHDKKKRRKTSARTFHGKASWYGKRFSGRKTASGDRFHPGQLSAAHRTLPLGTKVRVTNLENHKSAVLEINDRPARHARSVIDVSKGAARKLGFVGDGLTDVRVDVLSRPAPAKR